MGAWPVKHGPGPNLRGGLELVRYLRGLDPRHSALLPYPPARLTGVLHSYAAVAPVGRSLDDLKRSWKFLNDCGPKGLRSDPLAPAVFKV